MMNMIARNTVLMALGTGALMACNPSAAPDADGQDVTAPAGFAAEEPSPVVATLECEPLGDTVLSIETAQNGTSTLLTAIQSELDPDAEPIRFPLEATGADSGGTNTRLSDVNGEFTVTLMTDGSATIQSGENEVSCKA